MDGTRERILQAAFEEFYKNGFQGGSLNHIAERSGATKGALFHYFKNKAELGYAIVEEVIQPSGNPRWIDPLKDASDPIETIKTMFRRNIREDVADTEMIAHGCPLNNLAQEMSPLDEGFRMRIERSYRRQRQALVDALERAKKSGQIKKNVATKGVAALIVACQMGIWGTMRNTQDAELMIQSGEALCAFLDSLKS
ncbi:MAG TPA: TetR/AcrR family transcriptional regulator [Candidatus Acidoferrales bacterium]|nr:TetR/AcrR family transcriptional regulator [Candidatus Acidoferrales bacterium]